MNSDAQGIGASTPSSPSRICGLKRGRETTNDEGDVGGEDLVEGRGEEKGTGEGEGDAGGRRVRPRLEGWAAPETPSGAWGWLQLPWDTFRKGLAEGFWSSRATEA